MHEQDSILIWFDKLIDRWKGEGNKRMLTLSMFILWRIWKCRNEKAFEGRLIEPQQGITMAVRDVTEYVHTCERRVYKWQREMGLAW